MPKKMFITVLALVLSLGLIGCGDDIAEDIDVPEMILVEAGTTSENNGSITVEKDFYIGKYHVTQAEFEEVMGFNPSVFDGNPDHPVETVTLFDAMKYCNELSAAEGLEKYYEISDIEYNSYFFFFSGNRIINATVNWNEEANGYRLPTKDEWEYAACGGKNGEVTTYAGSDDLNEVGWYKGNSNYNKFMEFLEENDPRSKATTKFLKNNPMTKSIGKKKANELGIYDMSGNVSDWTNDLVTLGGDWCSAARVCEVSKYSNRISPEHCNFDLGFRLSKTK